MPHTPRSNSVDASAVGVAPRPAWPPPPPPHQLPRLSINTAAAMALAMPGTAPPAPAFSDVAGAGSGPGPAPSLLPVPISAPAHIASFAAAAPPVRPCTGPLPPAPAAPAAATSGGDGGGIKTISLAGARERKRHNSWAGTAATGPGGPANVQVSRCDQAGCTKAYAGPNAVSNLKRHKANVHHIPLSAQPRHTRWDHNPNRPKDEQERRERMLEAKRKYARKARARQKAAQNAAKAGLRLPPGALPLPALQALCAPSAAHNAQLPTFPLLPSHAPRQAQAPGGFPGLVFYTPQTAQVALPPSQPGGPLMPRPHSVPTTHIPLPPVPDEPSLLQPLNETGGNALGLLGEHFAPFPSLEGLSLSGLASDMYFSPSTAAAADHEPALFQPSGGEAQTQGTQPFPLLQDTPAFPPSRWCQPGSTPQGALSLDDTAFLPLSLAADESEVGMSSTDTQLTIPSIGGDASPALQSAKFDSAVSSVPGAGAVQTEVDSHPLVLEESESQREALHQTRAAAAAAPPPGQTEENPTDAWICGLLPRSPTSHGDSGTGTGAGSISLSPWKTWLGPAPDASPPPRPSSTGGLSARPARGWERVQSC